MLVMSIIIWAGGSVFLAHLEDERNRDQLNLFLDLAYNDVIERQIFHGVSPEDAPNNALELLLPLGESRDELARAMRWNSQTPLQKVFSNSHRPPPLNTVLGQLSVDIRQSNWYNLTTQAERDETGMIINDTWAHGAHQAQGFLADVPMDRVRDVERPDIETIIENNRRPSTWERFGQFFTRDR